MSRIEAAVLFAAAPLIVSQILPLKYENSIFLSFQGLFILQKQGPPFSPRWNTSPKPSKTDNVFQKSFFLPDNQLYCYRVETKQLDFAGGKKCGSYILINYIC